MKEITSKYDPRKFSPFRMRQKDKLTIDVYRLPESEIVTVDIPDVLFESFQEMVQRATDKWPDAPAEIKHFADVITSGRPMQDYFANPHLAGKVHANPADRDYAKKT